MPMRNWAGGWGRYFLERRIFQARSRVCKGPNLEYDILVSNLSNTEGVPAV